MSSLRRHARRLSLLAALSLAAVVPAGCGGAEPLDGTVRISGSTTLLPMISQIAGTFAAEHPLVRMDVDMRGTAEGLTLLCDGLVPLAGASRPIDPRERAACDANDIRLGRVVVARDAVVLLVARQQEEPVCVTIPQAYALAGPESTEVTAWDRVAEVDAGLGALPAVPLRVVGPGSESGTLALFLDLAIAPVADVRGTEAGLRADYVPVTSEQLILGQTIGTPGTLAVVGFATAAPWAERVRRLEVDGGRGCVPPTAETIQDGEYPFSRELYLYANLDAVAEDPVLRAFAARVVSPEGFAAAGVVGGVALDQSEGDAERDRWQRLLDDGGAE